MDLTILVGVVLIASCIGTLAYAYYVWRRMKLIEETPTSKVGEVSQGTVEVEGTARPDGETLVAPFTDEECIAYEYEVEEYQRRRDSDGRDDGTWSTIDSGSRVVPFRVVDRTGELKVSSYSADLKLYDEEYSEDGNVGGLGVGQSMTGSARFGRKRRTEKHIAVGDPVYVYGHARKDGDGVEITDDSSTPMFLISDQMADQLANAQQKTVIGTILLGLGCATAGVFLISQTVY